MNKQEIVGLVKALGLPTGKYVVFGSCPLAVAGLREANDIDMLVSAELYEQLERAGWREVDKGKNDKPITKGPFEAHKNWDFSSYSPTLQQLLKSADVIDGVPFASLQEVRRWKAASGRPKDCADVDLIDNYVGK